MVEDLNLKGVSSAALMTELKTRPGFAPNLSYAPTQGLVSELLRRHNHTGYAMVIGTLSPQEKGMFWTSVAGGLCECSGLLTALSMRVHGRLATRLGECDGQF